MAWELRRVYASRLFWLQALGFFCFMCFMTWAQRAPQEFGSENVKTGTLISNYVAGTSAWGLFHILPYNLVLLVLLLPFVTADGITRDLSRRTHELLMTTALPPWAYVWGRYLMSLMMGLGLAVLLLAATLSMGWLLHLTTTDYPAPEIGTVLLLWVSMVVPATILVSNLGFALGTLLPRLSTLVKVMLLLGWIVGGVILPLGLHDVTPPAWYVNWYPTSAGTALGLIAQYTSHFQALESPANPQHLLVTIENTMPSIGDWFAPHLLLAGASLALVLIAAFAFKRSRETLN
jgi:ABC-type transport system involved in multi-copper enzyme maturation permease subunit